jgi:hypothetical protein
MFRGGIISLMVTCLLPHCICARADTVYAWCGDSTIRQFTTNDVGSVLASNVVELSGWNGPVGLALDNSGSLYSGCPGTSTVTKWMTNGIGIEVGFADSVSGLAFDRTNNIYMTIPNYNSICRGYFTVNCIQTHLNNPTTLAFDKAGNIYVANGVYPYPWSNYPYTNTIAKFSPDLTYLGDFATNLNQPWGLAFDRAGNLFVSNSGNHKIYKYTPEGVRTVLNLLGLNNPRGIAFDSVGNLYVANAGNGTVMKFLPSGIIGSAFASGLNAPTSIAIQPGLKLWATPFYLINPVRLLNGAFQFGFANNAGETFSVSGTTNLALPLNNWTALGGVTEISPGQFQFTDPQATNNPQRFYRIRAN